MSKEKSRDSALLVAINHRGEVVLVKKTSHRAPMLRIPGGTVEDGETPLAAAEREFLEETGMCRLSSYYPDQKPVPLFSEWNERHEHWYHVYGEIVPEFSGLHATAIPDGPDMLEVEVCDLDEAFADGVMVPQHLRMLRKAVAKLAESA